jgi:hypothetical protein
MVASVTGRSRLFAGAGRALLLSQKLAFGVEPVVQIARQATGCPKDFAGAPTSVFFGGRWIFLRLFSHTHCVWWF